jgi:hypothetical protein
MGESEEMAAVFKERGPALLVIDLLRGFTDPAMPLIVKKYASAFFGTDLVSRLNARRRPL